MLRHSSFFFADKNVLNDPTDCNPSREIDFKEEQIPEVADSIIKNSHGIYSDNIIAMLKYLCNETKLIKKASKDTSNEEQGGRIAIVDELHKMENINMINMMRTALLISAQTKSGKFVVRKGHQDDILAIQAKWVPFYNIINYHIDKTKILSLSDIPYEPKMWAHYGDSHRGLCVEIEINEVDIKTERIGRVQYTTERPTILLSEILRLAKDKESSEKREIYKKLFLTKSTGWEYEHEWRLFLPKIDYKDTNVILDLPEGEYRTLDYAKIKSIIFGINTSRSDIALTVRMANKFAEFLPEFKLKKAVANTQSYSLVIEEYKQSPWDDLYL
jgi:hypothetical protein